MDGKAWYASKTLWANGLMVLAAILEATGVTHVLTPDVQAEVLVVIMGAVNLALRFVTSQSLTK